MGTKKTWIILPTERLSALLNIFGTEKHNELQVLNQIVTHPILTEKQVFLTIKREDLLDPNISGNKYRKLKYNLINAKESGFGTLLTFGGAFSNHIAATAYAGKINGFKTIGVIRGDELLGEWRENPTLKRAYDCGMQFKFVSREEYRIKDGQEFMDRLREAYGEFYLLPEGGTNSLAIKGCEEIIGPGDEDYDVVCCAVGTGGTIAGIINSAADTQRVLGFPAVKGDFLNEDIRRFARKENWELQTDYHFGGYAKVNEGLIRFINDFKERTGIPLDGVYTGKMIFGIMDMIQKGYFLPNTKILAVHTGGLQGIEGMNQGLKKKNLPWLTIG